MTNIMACLFVDVHSWKPKLTLFRDGNCFIIAFTISEYCLWQMLLRVEADSSTRLLRNALYDRRSLRLDIVFQAIWAKTNSNMRYCFDVSWGNSEVWKSLAASLERFVGQFSQYGSNLNVKYELPLHPYYCNSSTSLPFQDTQRCFVDSRTGQFSYFQLG